MAAPATPANLDVEETGSNAIYLSWDNVAGELGFYLYRSEDDLTYTMLAIIDVDTLLFWDGYVEFETKYYYKIAAYFLRYISCFVYPMLTSSISNSISLPANG